MSTRAWVLVVVGYVLLAIGLLAALVVNDRNVDKLERQTNKIQAVAAAYCQGIMAREADEAAFMRLLAASTPPLPQESLDPACIRIEEALED